MLLEPAQVEALPPGALRWRQREIRVRLQRQKELDDDASACRPRAIAVEPLSGVTLAPAIEQRVSWSRIEPAH